MRTEIFTAPHDERGESRRGSACPPLRCLIKEGLGGPAAGELHSTEPKNGGSPHLFSLCPFPPLIILSQAAHPMTGSDRIIGEEEA